MPEQWKLFCSNFVTAEITLNILRENFLYYQSHHHEKELYKSKKLKGNFPNC